jgi:hypothetical protein
MGARRETFCPAGKNEEKLQKCLTQELDYQKYISLYICLPAK